MKYKYLDIERAGEIDLERDLDTDWREYLFLGDTLLIIVHQRAKHLVIDN